MMRDPSLTPTYETKYTQYYDNGTGTTGRYQTFSQSLGQLISNSLVLWDIIMSFLLCRQAIKPKKSLQKPKFTRNRPFFCNYILILYFSFIHESKISAIINFDIEK